MDHDAPPTARRRDGCAGPSCARAGAKCPTRHSIFGSKKGLDSASRVSVRAHTPFWRVSDIERVSSPKRVPRHERQAPATDDAQAIYVKAVKTAQAEYAIAGYELHQLTDGFLALRGG
jgi:hypothetical protein